MSLGQSEFYYARTLLVNPAEIDLKIPLIPMKNQSGSDGYFLLRQTYQAYLACFLKQD
jgi:hypothetical protein